MKIYTGTGDRGETSLFSGQRVRKNDARVAAYGTLDEMNSVLGAAVAAGPQEPVRSALLTLQSAVFELGADLATILPPGKPSRITEQSVREIETRMDHLTSLLPKKGGFVLPGGTLAASQIHVARTIARRAEREALAVEGLAETSKVPLVFLNRLSDYLFLLAAYENHLAGAEVIPWVPAQQGA